LASTSRTRNTVRVDQERFVGDQKGKSEGNGLGVGLLKRGVRSVVGKPSCLREGDQMGSRFKKELLRGV